MVSVARLFVCGMVLTVFGLFAWSSTQAADPPGNYIESKHITVHATHDTAHVSWDAGATDIVYSVTLYRDYEYWNYSSFYFAPQGPFSIGPDAPYEVTINDLEPDYIYVVEVTEASDHDRFPASVSFQTEPVPDDLWETSIAQNLKATSFGNRILLGWDCLRQPLAKQFEVSIKEYGAPQDVAVIRTVDCAADGYMSSFLQQGTIYEVALSLPDRDQFQQRMLVSIPSPVREREPIREEAPTWGAALTPLTDRRGWEIAVSVEDKERLDAFEVEWIRDGHRLTRIGTEATITFVSGDPGPFPIRVRWINRLGASSPWSPTRLVGLGPEPPGRYSIRYEIRDSELHVSWQTWAGGPPSGIDGYRAYLLGEGSQTQAVDTGSSQHAVFDLDPDVTDYAVLIGAYSSKLGLGELTRVEIDVSREPELRLYLDSYRPSCSLDSGTPVRGFWWFRDGESPFWVTVGEQEPVTSVLPYGAFESGCTASEGSMTANGNRLTEVAVKVEDALGRRMSEVLSYEISSAEDEQTAHVAVRNRPSPVGLELYSPRIGDTGIGMVVERRSAESQWSLSSFVIRWRVPGERYWNYEHRNLDFAHTSLATILWKGLNPNTPYEFQVAVRYLGIEVEQIPEEAWSAIRQVTTLPQKITPDVSREGTTVTVRWSRFPSAWEYTIVLRGEDESWWKSRVQDGADVQQIVVEDIPVDTELDIEVLTPPIGAPRWNSYVG